MWVHSDLNSIAIQISETIEIGRLLVAAKLTSNLTDSLSAIFSNNTSSAAQNSDQSTSNSITFKVTGKSSRNKKAS